MAQVACLGECMIELREMADGRFSRGYGGDTLNTAVYLARLGVAVDYVTALGDDLWSDEMLAGWAAEGVGTGRVARLPGRVPGLYIIQTDARGERRFSYWRDSAPARALFDGSETAEIVAALPSYDLLYFSGITLSLYGDAGRARFVKVLDGARAQGRRIAFDTNFRPRGWPDRAVAQAAYRTAFDRANIVLASTEDLELLFGAEGVQEILSHRSSAELVLKLPTPACRVISSDRDEEVQAEPVAEVVDTTAAGDSFAAAYMAARLSGDEPREAARAGHRLAGAVVRHPGAIIPHAAMPAGLAFRARSQHKEMRA
ncbi:MAG: sugar kinase [Xanthobacteraceae bacterium]